MQTGQITDARLGDVYEFVARLLSYPDEEFAPRLALGRSLVAVFYPDSMALLNGFEAGVAELKREQLEELYIGTFDVQAACCLDVGYSVFGEDYKRGRCLAELKVIYARYGVDLGKELPDFLPNLLKLLPRLPYGDAAEIVQSLILPAIEKMRSGFGAAENPYANVLALAEGILRKDYVAH